MTPTTLQDAVPVADQVPSDALVLGTLFLLAIVLIAMVRRGGIRAICRMNAVKMLFELDPESHGTAKRKAAKNKKSGAKKALKNKKSGAKRRQPQARRGRPVTSPRSRRSAARAESCRRSALAASIAWLQRYVNTAHI